MLAQQRYLAAIATNRSDNSTEESVAVKVVRDRPKDNPPNQKHRRSDCNHGHVTHSTGSNDRGGQQQHYEEVEEVPSEKRGTKSLWNPTAVVKDSSFQEKLPQLKAFQQSQMRWNNSHQQPLNILGVEADQQDDAEDDDDALIQSRNGSTSPSRIRPIRAIVPSLRETGGLGLFVPQQQQENECNLISSKNGEVGVNDICETSNHDYKKRYNEKHGYIYCRDDNFKDVRDEPQEKATTTVKCLLSDKHSNFVSVKSRLKQWDNAILAEPPKVRVSSNKVEGGSNGGSKGPSPQGGGGGGRSDMFRSTKIKTKSIVGTVSAETNVGLQRPKQSPIVVVTGTTSFGNEMIGKEKQQQQQQQQPQEQLQKQHLDNVEMPRSNSQNPSRICIKQRALVFGATVSRSSLAISKRNGHSQRGDGNSGDVTIQNDSDKKEFPTSNENVPSLNYDSNRTSIQRHAGNHGESGKNDRFHHRRDKNEVETNGEVGKTSSDDCQNKGSIENFIPKANDCRGIETCIASGGVRDIRSLFESLPGKGSSTVYPPLKRTSISKSCSTNEAKLATCHTIGIYSNQHLHVSRDKGVKHNRENEIVKISVKETESKNEPKALLEKNMESLLPGKGSSTVYPPLKRTSISKSCSTNEAKQATCHTIGIHSNKHLHVSRDKGVKHNRENEIVKISVKETESKNEPKALLEKNMESCAVGVSEPTSYGTASNSLPDDTNVTNATSTSVGNNVKMASVEDVDEGTIVTKTRDVSPRGFNALRSKFESISNNQRTSHHSQNDSVRFRKASEFSNLRVKHTHHKFSQATKDSDIYETDKMNVTTSDKGILVNALHPAAKESSPIGCKKRSAFENIRSRFNGEERHSRSPDRYRPDNSLVQFVNSQRILKQSPIIQDSSMQLQPQSQLLCDQKQRSVYEVHRKSAFNIYNASMLKSSKQKDRDGNARVKNDDIDIDMLPPNDIPWKHIEPNDIPWTDRELLEERERSFSTQKVDMSFSYGAEYLDYSYEDDDCDGVTLCPSASDVSSLSVPSCLRSVDVSSETSFASRTSDEDTGAMESMSEKQSTTLGPSEASSSQTSEAAAPLIHSTLGAMSMRFASSSDTTGTFSYNGAQFNALLGALPPPIDGEESDDNSDDLVFQQLNKRCYNYEKNKQFEDALKLQSGPKWKNDFFAVDSVKSLPTVDSADVNWVTFPTDSSGKESLHKKSTKCPVDKKETNVFHSVQRLARNSSKYFSVKSTSYPTQDARMASPFNVSQNSTPTPLPRRVESTQSDTENRVPKPNDTESKLGTGAYRRFDVHRVRAFQQARRNKSFAPT